MNLLKMKTALMEIINCLAKRIQSLTLNVSNVMEQPDGVLEFK